MSDSLKTSLSAFVDGEASTDESSQLLQQLAEDEELRTEWKNYHSIAAVLRNEDVSNLQSPTDWDALAEELPANGDVLPFRSRNRIKNMLVHGGIGAGLAACIMVALFFMFAKDTSESTSNVANTNTTEDTLSDALASRDIAQQPFPFDGSFESSGLMIPPDILEDLHQMMQDALFAHDISRSGIEQSLMHDANVLSRNVSEEL
ncbi:MAG: sigma-E factor negative regulatory protein [Gammaproteobacteria bacterium]|nr:sigma-E factor negative regulatory protein [Gammaproteobacteria bacterium]MYF02386.1 sigma-E factor negative regulatory protein [Gammaproteobacteria bacterium]MYI77194.1 sigma-E factor negative regulatory protein [Gammaproteobacteria bacterium]